MKARRQDLKKETQTMIRNYFTMDDASISLSVMLEREKYGKELSSILEGLYAGNWVFWLNGRIDLDAFPPEDIVLDMAERWKNKFMAIYDSTKDRYEVILDAYADNRDKLMDKIRSSTTARFNDTPQNSGDFSDDPYTSTITQTSSETDLEDNMTKLNKVQSGYRNILRE